MANLQAGFARVDVTPPLGIEISGYFVERFASGILDALEASALALRCGDDQAILIALDNLMIDKETMYAYRAAIAERTGVKAEAVFIACSGRWLARASWTKTSTAKRNMATIWDASCATVR